MNKVLIIGIDALDSETLGHLVEELPSFRRIINHGPKMECDGVFPPDSPTSWASIYTGLNPANHGIVLFVDPLKRVSTMITMDVDDSTIRNRTFWDKAGSVGKKVCIVPHLLGYPPWEVNGIMIGRSGITQDVQVTSKKPLTNLDLSRFRWGLDLFPGSNKKDYLKRAELQLRRETEAGLELFAQEEWDIFFISFGELDPIQYSFWSYYDKNDPAYPGRNRYERVIPDSYKLFDEVIGRFLRVADANTSVIIVSDHGIGSRPVNLVNINEFLRRQGVLKTKGSPKGGRTRTRRMILSAVDKLELGNLAAKALRAFPTAKDHFISSPNIDWESSLAYLTDQSGIKNYPYGGIMLNNDATEETRRRGVQDSIISSLSSIVKPGTQKKVFKWAMRREDLYKGSYIERYPSIVFELDEEYGAGSTAEGNLWGKSLTHTLAPGCHKQHHATFILSTQSTRETTRKRMSIVDVAPTILDLLDIQCRRDELDGSSIFR